MDPRTPLDPPLDRRGFLAGSLVGSGAFLVGCSSTSNPSFGEPVPAGPSAAATATETMTTTTAQGAPFQLPPLPYEESALEPVISARTFSFHYGKHHKAYVDNLNNLVKDKPDLAALKLEELVKRIHGDPAKAGIFNNAAQVWNHTFFWSSMRQGGGGKPTGRILERIQSSFGGYDEFKNAFAEAAKTQFGSGWAWLIEDGGKLAVVKTPNAETPMAQGKKCLLTLDVWEHAYYLDYQNRRPDFIAAFLDKLVNWEFAERNLG
jgi:Fe-Mn family superoxide dismutase